MQGLGPCTPYSPEKECDAKARTTEHLNPTAPAKSSQGLDCVSVVEYSGVMQVIEPGATFARLTYLRPHPERLYQRRAGVFVCLCGTERVLPINSVLVGNTKSCGCIRKGAVRLGSRTANGECARRSPEYNAWRRLRRVCRNPKDPGFAEYGGRGVQVCAAWSAYPAFVRDVGRRPSEHHVFRLKAGFSEFRPGACGWVLASPGVSKNKSVLVIDGETKSRTEWLVHFGVSAETFYHRTLSGLTPIEALQKSYETFSGYMEF